MSLASFLLGSSLRRLIGPRARPATRTRRPRLEPLESRDLPSTAPLHRGFGTPRSPVAAAYTRAGRAGYDPSAGYGWASLAGLTAYNLKARGALTRDGVRGPSGLFEVDLADGTYQVTATLGHGHARRGKVDVLAGGELEAAGVTSKPGRF